MKKILLSLLLLASFFASAQTTTKGGSSGGTVTGVSIVSANGLAGTCTATSTPACTLSTSVNGIAVGNGTSLSAATSASIGVPITVVTTSPVTPASATPVSSGLSITTTSGGTYLFEIHYYGSASATANTTITLNFGTVTATSVIGTIAIVGDATFGNPTVVEITSLATTRTYAGTIASFIEHAAVGTIVVNAGGTFTPGYATAATSTDSLLAGSWMRLTRIN